MRWTGNISFPISKLWLQDSGSVTPGLEQCCIFKGSFIGYDWFENKRKLRELEEQARILQWQQTLNAVKENRVTPVELKEIEQKAEKNDPQAIEVYAYIYARGIGVKPDLPKAFQLYQKAEKLNVPNALQNAAKVYKAMSPKQRKELSPLKAKN